MANASTRTLLPLDEFAEIIGYHPILFNQVTIPQITPDQPDTGCVAPLLRYSWQASDRIGREEIAQNLAMAESLLAERLAFKVAPTWEMDESHEYGQQYTMWNWRDHQTLRTQFGHVHYGGIEAKTLIDAGAAITYSDEDTDGYAETATITATTIVTNPDEIAIYYPDTDADENWQIEPVRVTITGGTVTIVTRRERLVKQEKLTTLIPTPVAALDNAAFLTDVDIYRRYNDPATSVTLEWREACCTPELGTFTTQTGYLQVIDSAMGFVKVIPATWDADSQTYTRAYLAGCRPPDRVRLWYKAGWRHARHLYAIDPLWARTVTYFALALLDRPFCECNTLKAFTERWREDLAAQTASSVGGMSYKVAPRIVGNPFGTYRGAVYAWERVLRYANKEVDHGV